MPTSATGQDMHVPNLVSGDGSAAPATRVLIPAIGQALHVPSSASGQEFLDAVSVVDSVQEAPTPVTACQGLLAPVNVACQKLHIPSSASGQDPPALFPSSAAGQESIVHLEACQESAPLAASARAARVSLSASGQESSFISAACQALHVPSSASGQDFVF